MWYVCCVCVWVCVGVYVGCVRVCAYVCVCVFCLAVRVCVVCGVVWVCVVCKGIKDSRKADSITTSRDETTSEVHFGASGTVFCPSSRNYFCSSAVCRDRCALSTLPPH